MKNLGLLSFIVRFHLPSNEEEKRRIKVTQVQEEDTVTCESIIDVMNYMQKWLPPSEVDEEMIQSQKEVANGECRNCIDRNIST